MMNTKTLLEKTREFERQSRPALSWCGTHLDSHDTAPRCVRVAGRLRVVRGLGAGWRATCRFSESPLPE